MYHSAHVEVRGQLCGIGSLLPPTWALGLHKSLGFVEMPLLANPSQRTLSLDKGICSYFMWVSGRFCKSLNFPVFEC